MPNFLERAPDLSVASKNEIQSISTTTGLNLSVSYKSKIASLHRKYPDTPVVRVTQGLNEQDFGILKRKLNEGNIEGAAIGIITTKDGILLTKRAETPPYGWSLIGGKANFGERLRVALTREAREEGGVDAKIEQKPLIMEHKTYVSQVGEKLMLWLVTFRGHVAEDQTPYTTDIAKKEGLTVKVFDRQNLPTNMVAPDREKIYKFGAL